MRQLLFNAGLALRAIKLNKLRSGITIGIIALGLMALIGILTAIQGLKSSIYSNFSTMGANTFQITKQSLIQKKGKHGISINYLSNEDISFRQAEAFKDQYNFPATVGISMVGTGSARLQYGSTTTNPNVVVLGVDDQYLTISETDLAVGRNFNATDLSTAAYVCILGYDLGKKFFGDHLDKGLQQKIQIGNTSYLVVGIATSKGSNMISNINNNVFIPLQTGRVVYDASSFAINVHLNQVSDMAIASSEAEGLFRKIRGLPPEAENNFGLQKNDDLASMVLSNITTVSGAALFIGLITLAGAAIGLMNIMLVSVAERTREIGVIKALGAKSKTVKNQFLTEAVVISLLGGFLGIFLGILIGNVVSLFLKTGFIIPWAWISIGFILCSLVGLLSGVYPAIKASKLDPIQALRYE